MKESESFYVNKFIGAVNNVLDKNKYKVSDNENQSNNLFYELTVDQYLTLNVKDIKKPVRGESAFQTDLCIYEKRGDLNFPRVVIEFKLNPSTHDIIIYSNKAERHKLIYPWLRYGMIMCELDNLPIRKFAKHNDYMDFCVAVKEFFDASDESVLANFAHKLILSEIQMSETIESIFFSNKKQVEFKRNFYSKQIQLGNFFNFIV